MVSPLRLAAQSIVEAPESKSGRVIGTVLDLNGDAIPNANVELRRSDSEDRRRVVTPGNGFFEFQDVTPGVPYEISVTAQDFAAWTSPSITLQPGQFKIVTGIKLRIETQQTTVNVHYDPVEVATEQLKIEETQRVFGILPNFYVTYEENAAPLTAKMKFKLALRVSVDPVTTAGVLLVASSKQAADTPNYGQGWGAFGERIGAVGADGISDIMIGGAILPSLLHQDPRYFYQGTGTTGSRVRHALFSPFVARNDNGSWGPNYSSIGGDLASSALANLWYPKSNRGAQLVFGQFAIGTAERMGASLAQEFLIARFTRRAGHMK
ncbi:MAG: carboxypeptidase regulatory-like domain-containing protein [Acidobacteriaceae bacterium]|nr:carboxypeptidase regulatory-like domain-containing protein [Acidobacteriaceae bacterium]